MHPPVIPAEAVTLSSIQGAAFPDTLRPMIWTPAFAGVTGEGARPVIHPPVIPAEAGIQVVRL